MVDSSENSLSYPSPETALRIIADHREKASGIPERLEAIDHVTLTYQSLPSGDYLIDGRVLIERKTISDFALSIIDTRLFKQASALTKSPFRCAFLVEGRGAEISEMGMTREALQGALISLSLIFNIPVIRALDKAETVRLLVYAANQLQRLRKGLFATNRYTPKTRTGRQLHLLQSLPGIGRDRAKLLLEEFGTVEKCITADAETLMKIEGIGPKTANAIRNVVSEASAQYGSDLSDWDF